MNIKIGNMQSNNIQIGNNNVMNTNNRDSVFIQDEGYLEEHVRPLDCRGCGFVNPVENSVCEYCGRVL